MSKRKLEQFEGPYVKIAPPLAGRVYGYVFTVLWVVFLGSVVVGGLIRGAGIWPAVLILAVFVVPAVAMAMTLHRVGVRTVGRELVVRSQFRTTRIAARDIEDFRIVEVRGRPPTLCVARKVGAITELPTGGQAFWGVGRHAVERRRDELRRWLVTASGDDPLDTSKKV